MKSNEGFNAQTRIPLALVTLLFATPLLAEGYVGNAEHGSVIFHQTCIACHGANGTGAVPGTPNFTQADGVLTLPDKMLENRVEKGFSCDGLPVAMPPKGGNPDLTINDIKDVLSYLRTTFLKTDPPTTAKGL